LSFGFRPIFDCHLRPTSHVAGRVYTLGLQALKRLAQPDDIGGVVAFLTSDDARWIGDNIVRVDGGSKL
jgi:3-oxoacyl-[acyl-carrier protein] reductase